MLAGRLPNWRSAMDNPQPLARGVCIAIVVVLIGLEVWPSLSLRLEKPSSTSSRAAAPVDTANVEQITAAELFGRSANQNANLPQTTLPVTLRAVFAASNPQAASAVIETSDGRTQIIKVGAAVDTSTTLQTVHPNRVVLMRNGELETLYFPTPQDLPAATLASAQNPALPEPATAAGVNIPAGMSAEDIKRSAILQRLEELRARTPR